MPGGEILLALHLHQPRHGSFELERAITFGIKLEGFGAGRRHLPGPRDRVVAARLGDDRGRCDAVLGGEDRGDRLGPENRPPPFSILRFDADQTAFVDQ